MADKVHDEVESLLQEFKGSPESVGIDLRMDLASIILRKLREMKWTQKQLASESGLKASYISRLIHAEANCTFESAGRILHALGLRAQLAPVIDDEMYITDASTFKLTDLREHHGEEEADEEEVDSRIRFGRQGGPFRFSRPADEDVRAKPRGTARRSANLG